MADTRKIVKVFLASPGDLQNERLAAKSVVEEFNKQWADTLGYHIELVGWEDTVSGTGRPQALINRDLDQCELFIGVLWKRWGTPPDTDEKYSSGFEEEYDRAAESKVKSGTPEISLFFKNVDAESLRDPGPHLNKVLEFQNRIISEKIILFEKFEDSREFESKIRRCISTYVQRLHGEDEIKAAEQTQSRPTGVEETRTELPASQSWETPLSVQGAQFLRGFVTKTERQDQVIENIEVARFRLLASIVVQQGNDESILGAHDANLLYLHRHQLSLGTSELFGLLECGLDHFASENVPIWCWLKEVDPKYQVLALLSIVRSPTARRAAAIQAMRRLGTILSPKGEPNRVDLIASWFRPDSPDEIKVAALGYLADWGVVADLEQIRKELDRGDYRTTAASTDAIIRISLRESRNRAIEVLFELQPETVDRKLVKRIFEQANSLERQVLLRALEHRSGEVRRTAAIALRERKELEPAVAERLLSDTDAEIRLEALIVLVDAGRVFSDGEARKILVKPIAPGLSLGPADRAGEACLTRFRHKKWAEMPLPEHERLARSASIFDRDSYFALVARDFAKRGKELRSLVDDQFRAEYNKEIEIAKRLGVEDDYYKQIVSLNEYMCKELTRKGLNILCTEAYADDLARIRRVLKSGFVSYSDEGVEYLRKYGEWEDIQLIISLLERPDYARGLISFGDDEKNRKAALAAYAISRDRLDELINLEMPPNMKKFLLGSMPDTKFRLLTDDTIFACLQSLNDGVRKTAALKCIRSFTRSRLVEILDRYMAEDRRYYNVSHWLDMGMSLPRATASKIAIRALNEDY